VRSSACQTDGRGTERTDLLSVGISAARPVSAASAATATPPPRPASRVPASSGDSGIVSIDVNWLVDWTRPCRSGGVRAIR